MNPIGMVLKGLGIEIDPEQVVNMVQTMATDIAEMRASQARTEEYARKTYERVTNGRYNGYGVNSIGDANGTDCTDYP